MKKLISSLLIAAQLSAAAPVFAQQTFTIPDPPAPVPGEVDVGAAISPMKKGQIAPFTGVLLSPKATAVIITQIDTIQEQIKIEVDHARAEELAKCDFKVSETKTVLEADNMTLKAQVESRNKTIIVLNDVIKQQEQNRPNTPLWVGLGVGGGFVLGVGLSALAIYATSQTSK